MGLKRYEYLTGNQELAIRVRCGESLEAVLKETMPQWTPGNEYLWDEYDPRSLLDTPEKQQYLVNILLFGRICLYQALRAAGREVRGSDPLQFADQVPEIYEALKTYFPGVFENGARPKVQLEPHLLKLSPERQAEVLREMKSASSAEHPPDQKPG